jgi:heme/copper-type cytochrome/quinol oxidase subunit 1
LGTIVLAILLLIAGFVLGMGHRLFMRKPKRKKSVADELRAAGLTWHGERIVRESQR